MKELKRSPSETARDTKRLRKILHEEIRLGINPDSDSEEEEKVDLRKELYPLGHYINDREEMIEEMFSLIKGDKLRKMLPTILKDMPLDELKADCLIHLLGMSKKRIYAILEGRQIDSSSDSESHSDGSIKRSKRERFIVKPIVIKQEGCSDISDNSEEVVLIDPDSCESINSKTKKKSKKGGKRKHSEKLEKSKEVKKKKNVSKVEEDMGPPIETRQSDEASDSDNDNEEGEAPKKGKNLLEILELEMRARAIRALLHKDGPRDDDESNKVLEETTNATNHYDCDSSAEDSEESDKNRITPARNIRKRKITNDDVIVVAPKLVTIDLTDEIDSRIKNMTSEEPSTDSVVPGNECGPSNIINEPMPDISDLRHKPVGNALNDKNKESEILLNNEENEPDSITCDTRKTPEDKDKTPINQEGEPKTGFDDIKKPEDKTLLDEDTEPEIGLSSKSNCELEEGEIVTKEKGDVDHNVLEFQNEGSERCYKEITPRKSKSGLEEGEIVTKEKGDDHNMIELQNDGSERHKKEMVPSDEDCSVKQSLLDIEESSLNESELLELCETIILSDDDSTLSESSSIVEIDGKEPTSEKVVANSEASKSTNSGHQTSTQSVGESSDAITDTNLKKSWAQRWLESKEVKKVVSTSKLCGSIRKKIKLAKLAKKKLLEENQNVNKQEIAPPPQDIQGSVDEYQLLPKSQIVYNSEKPNGAEGESEAVQNHVSCLDKPTTDTSPNEQVQDVTSTENANTLDSYSKLTDENGQLSHHQQPAAVTETHCDKKQNETELVTYSTDQRSVLKMCDSSNMTEEQTTSDAIVAKSTQHDDTFISSNEVSRVVDTTIEQTLPKSPVDSSSETHLSEHPPNNDNEVKLISESVSNYLNESNDKLQSTSVLTVSSEKSSTQEEGEILDPDQNGPETLEINITDEELEIDGIINNIIDPSNEDVVWSKSKIVEID